MTLCVYSSAFDEFSKKILTNELFNELTDFYPNIVGHAAGKKEVNAWKTSLPSLYAAMCLAGLPQDVQVTLEKRCRIIQSVSTQLC